MQNLIFPDCRVLQLAKYFITRSENCTRTECYGWKYTVNAFQKCDLIAAWKCGLIIGCEFSAREKSREGSSGKDFTCFGPPNFQNQPPPTAPLERRARVFGLIIHKLVLESWKSLRWSLPLPDCEDLLRCESAHARNVINYVIALIVFTVSLFRQCVAMWQTRWTCDKETATVF